MWVFLSRYASKYCVFTRFYHSEIIFSTIERLTSDVIDFVTITIPSLCSLQTHRVQSSRTQSTPRPALGVSSSSYISISRFTNAQNVGFSFLVLHPNIAFLQRARRGLFRALHQFVTFSHIPIKEEYAPLPHVFPPSAYGRALRAGQHDAIDFVTIAIPSFLSLRRAHVKCRPLIMPLVALVQKNRAHPQLRTFVWCLALPFSAPCASRSQLRNERAFGISWFYTFLS